MGGTPDMIAVAALATSVVPVGSRVTCFPAPVGTDEDYLVLVPFGKVGQLESLLLERGWSVGGSIVVGDTTMMEGFKSWKHGDLNIIATSSHECHGKFMLATRIATRLNLMNKGDRIALFQTILYNRELD